MTTTDKNMSGSDGGSDASNSEAHKEDLSNGGRERLTPTVEINLTPLLTHVTAKNVAAHAED